MARIKLAHIQSTQYTMANVLSIFSFGLSRIRNIVCRIHRGSNTHTHTHNVVTYIVHSWNCFQRSLIRTNYDIYEQKSSHKIRCYPLPQSPTTFVTSLQLLAMRSLLEFSHISCWHSFEYRHFKYGHTRAIHCT